MRRGRGLGIVWTVAFAGVWLTAAPPIQAEEALRAPEIVALSVSGAHVTFSPRVGYERLLLTVAGGGHIVEREFAAGEIPTFAPVDREGFQLPDGIYKWEIKVLPRPRELTTADFSGDEMSADGRRVRSAPAARRLLQSGAFSIVSGALLDPNRVERQAASAREPSHPTAPGAPDVGADADPAVPHHEQARDRD